jgi:hypothetical protein
LTFEGPTKARPLYLPNQDKRNVHPKGRDPTTLPYLLSNLPQPKIKKDGVN